MKSLSGAKSVNVGIVGYGLVGAKLAEILEERGFPLGDTVRIFANKKSVGKTVRVAGKKIIVESAATANYRGLDIVFNTATADFSAKNAEIIHRQGPIFIDSSSARRLDIGIPLLIPEVNPEALSAMKLGIIAKPNCTTTISALVLHYLHNKAGLKSLSVNSYQSTSGQGQPGIDDHNNQVREMTKRSSELIHGQTKPYLTSAIFPAVTAFNVAPVAGTFEAGGHTSEELKFKNETRKIFGLSQQELPIDVTCARVDTFNGHALSIHAEFKNKITTVEANNILANADGVQLHPKDDVPQPIYIVGTDPVHVGRVRQSEKYGENGINFWVVGDNLRKGAALNAAQIAELLIKK